MKLQGPGVTNHVPMTIYRQSTSLRSCHSKEKLVISDARKSSQRFRVQNGGWDFCETGGLQHEWGNGFSFELPWNRIVGWANTTSFILTYYSLNTNLNFTRELWSERAAARTGPIISLSMIIDQQSTSLRSCYGKTSSWVSDARKSSQWFRV